MNPAPDPAQNPAPRSAVAAGPPAAASPAATVILLRDSPVGLQTWLLTRHLGLTFAGGMSVYPGGRVDAADGTVPLARPGVAAEVAAAFGVPVAAAHALVVAAVRETFEETGVLLAVPFPDVAGPGVDGREPSAAVPDLTAARTAVEAGELAFADLLVRHRAAVDGDAVTPWARWVTPVGEKRRYDTFFFVAVLPSGGVAADVTTESSTADWIDPATALSDGRALLPPTRETLTPIAAHSSAADVVAAGADRDLRPVLPILSRGPGGVFVELPDGRRLSIPVLV